MKRRWLSILTLAGLLLTLVGTDFFYDSSRAVEAAPAAAAAVQERLPEPGSVQAAGAEYVMRFSGSDSYVEVPHDMALNPTGAFTLEAWVKRDSGNRCESVIQKGTAYWLGFCNARLRFYAAGPGTAEDGLTAVPANVWTHIAVVYEGSGRKYYINGELDYTGGPELAPITNALAVTIGGDAGAGGNDFLGAISNVRLWSVARSQDEIRHTLHVALEEALPGLVANWRFGAGTEDNVGGFDGVAHNALLFFDRPPAQPAYADLVDGYFNTLPTFRYAAATTYVPALDALVLDGGRTGPSALTSAVHLLDAGTGASSLLVALPTALTQAAAAYAPTTGLVYVFGGSTSTILGDGLQNSIYAIDPVSATVTLLTATLPFPAAAQAAVYYPDLDRIYLFGGLASGGEFTDIWVFDPATAILTPASFSLPAALREVSAAYSEATGKVYLFGGLQGFLETNVIYEVTLGSDGLNGAIRSLPATLPHATGALGATLDPWTQLIYLAGGANQDRLWVFDPLTEQVWATRVALSPTLTDPGVAFSALHRHLVIAGGSPDSGNVWRVPLGDGPLVPLGRWDFPAPAGAQVNSIEGEGDGVVISTHSNGAWRIFGDGTREHYTAAALGSVNGRVHDGDYNPANGYVFLATDDAGAKLDNGATLTSYGGAVFGTNQVLSIDAAGLYGTAGQGLWRRAYNPISDSYYWVQFFDGRNIGSLALRSPGDAWLLSSGFLARYQYSLIVAGTATTYTVPCALLSPTDLAIGANGDWWAVSPGIFEFGGSGICRIPAAGTPGVGATVSPDTTLGDDARAVDVDGDGRVWVALLRDDDSGSGGLAAFEVTGSSTAVVRSTEYNWLNAPLGSRYVYTRPGGTLWDSSVYAVGATEERVWAGKTDGRLVTLAPRWQQLDQNGGIGEAVVENVWTVRGRAFLATTNSLHVLAPDGVTWDDRTGVKVWDVLGDRQGRIWVATNTGIRLYTPGGWDYLTDREGIRPATATYALAEDQDGRIWIGGLHGLTLFDRDRFVATFTTADTPLPADAVHTLFVDRENHLWVGTNSGLARLVDAGWTTFTTADGLPDNAIFDLEQMGAGDLAISTLNGLAFYDGSTFTLQTLPIDDNNLPLTVDESGRLWARNAVFADGIWKQYFTTNSGLASTSVSDNAGDGADRVWFSHAPDPGVSVRGAYLPPLANVVPVVSGITPTEGRSGDVITIQGSGFGSSRYDVRVVVGRAAVNEVLSVTPTEIRVRLGDANTSGDVTVWAGGRSSALSGAFCAIPTVDSFSPTGGNDGVQVRVFGKNFDPSARLFLGGSSERMPYVLDATQLWTDIRPGDGAGPVQVVNQCGHTASGAGQFRRITLSIELAAFNQGIPATGLVAQRRTLAQYYLRHSIAPRSTDRIELDSVELTVNEPGRAPQRTILEIVGAVNTLNAAPTPAQLRDIANSVNVSFAPVVSGNFAGNRDVVIQAALRRRGQTVAQRVSAIWVRPNRAVHVLLVPIMNNSFTSAQLRDLRNAVDRNLGDLRNRMWPTGRVDFSWAPTAYRVNDVLWLGGSTVDIGDTLVLYDVSHKLDRARRSWNAYYSYDTMVAFGVVEPSVNSGTVPGKAFWPGLSQMLNLAGLEALDALCDVGATLINIFTFGAADASCDLEIPLYVGWAEQSSNASELIGHELGHIFGLVQPTMPNGDLFDNFSHSVYDEIDGGECNTLFNAGSSALYNPLKTLYRAAGVTEPVINPLTGNQFRAQLGATDTWGSVTSGALFPRGKAIMSYACARNNDNAFFEPADVVGVYYEYAVAPARDFFDDLLPGRMRAAGTGARALSYTGDVTPTFVPGERLYVSGMISRTANAGQLREVSVLPETAALDLSYMTGYWLVQLDGSSHEITRTGIFPVFSTTGDADNDAGFFAATILKQAGLATLELRHDDVVLDSLIAGSSAPTVAVSSPAGGTYGDAFVPVAWSASDADGDALEATLLYSADGGATWTPVGFGAGSGTADVPVMVLAGSNDARIKVIVSDGFHSGEATSAAFTVMPQAPFVYIQTPATDTLALEGAPIYLTGGAMDNQDGALAGAALRWSSSRDGELGTGETLDARLSVGMHVLTLQATNSAGLSDTTSVTLTVAGDYDYDGISDADELAAQRNILTPADAFEDSDGDGLSYIVEVRRGLDPADADSDDDGRNDGVEVGEGSDPATPDAPLPADALLASPAALTFVSDRALGTALPQQQVVLTSREPVTWTLTADVAWLAATQITGQTPDGVLILVNTEAVPADGTYTGKLTFASALGSVTVPVTATLTNVTAAPGSHRIYLPLVLR
ncbi:MAG: IPT/TIG domain-containing protein [Anaerolineae bacterium]|nr:IPT/TIG domain-containing protein [Anaerolineae bacterium]